MIVTARLLFFSLSLFLTFCNAHDLLKSDGHHAAECLTPTKNCSREFSNCVPGLAVRDQSYSCIRSACTYCLVSGHGDFDENCKSWDFKMWCVQVGKYVGMGESAARCIKLDDQCGNWLAVRSRHCASGIIGKRQPLLCKRAACKHCKVSNETGIECDDNNNDGRLKFCNDGSLKVGKNFHSNQHRGKEHGHHYARNCTYVAEHGRIVISMKDSNETGRWTRTKDGRGDGLTWRQGDFRTWVTSAGIGELCYRVKFTKYGSYFLTALTRAKGKRHHNDMFIRFSGGLQFLHARTMRHFPFKFRSRNSYFKAYQNVGVNRLTKVLSTINGSPHILVTNAVPKTRRYDVCISGRSSEFSVYALYLIKCVGENCRRTSEYMRHSLKNNTATPCINF